MDWKAFGSKIANVAPMLGTLFGGPLGGMAGGLIKMLAGEVGLKPEEATPDNFMKAIEADPNAVLKFKEFELNNKVELQKILLEKDRLDMQKEQNRLTDVQDARGREKTIVQTTGKKDLNLYVLAYLFIGGFFLTIIVMMGLMLTNSFPAVVPQFVVFLLGNLFGTLSAGVGAVMQYFYGSSKGSADKTATMVDQFQAQIRGTGKGSGSGGVEKMV